MGGWSGSKQASWDSPACFSLLSCPWRAPLCRFDWQFSEGPGKLQASPCWCFFFFFLAGKFAAIIASGRRKAPNGKETALSFATILLRSLNIISSPRLSLDSYLAHSHRSFKAPLRCHLSWEDSLTPQSVVGGAAQWSWTPFHCCSYRLGLNFLIVCPTGLGS